MTNDKQAEIENGPDGESEWKIGDTYYRASAELQSRPWDLGELSEECRTEAGAQANLDIWLSDLTDSDRRSAEGRIDRYRVTAIDEDGSIGSAESY